MDCEKYNEMNILELQKLCDAGDLDSQKLIQYYLERIEKYDNIGPGLNSVLQLNDLALQEAKELDRERELQGPRSPLHGIPIMIKGNIDTADTMETTAGSIALKGHMAKEDAPLVKNLREAGAIILGKTNMSEWANFRSSRSSSGWSSIGGQTRNPYDRERSPCGSSSGSGVAVSANFCAAAVGTETDGSIVCPSHMNGIVGIKPTVGLISGEGIIPIAHSQDTAGPMTRTVSDGALLLDAMSGSKKYEKALNKDSLSGARIGIAKNLWGFRKEIDELMEKAVEQMKKAGAIIVEDLELPSKGKYSEEEYAVLLYEFKTDLNAYLEKTEGSVKSLEDLIAFNNKHRDQVMPWFGQETLEKAQAKGSLEEKEYLDALAKCQKLSREEGIDKLMKEHDLKAFIAPTGGPSWKIDLINGDHYTGGETSQCAAVSGYPHITVPAGFVQGLPIGISFMGSSQKEEDLIGLAYAYEQISRNRKAPPF